jgi:hypothetical protein
MPPKKDTNSSKKKKVPVKNVKPTSVEAQKNKISADQIKALLKEALINSSQEYSKKTDIELEALCSTVQEFLRSFIIIGYNLDNDPIYMVNAESQLDADALYTALARVFFTTNQNGGL